MIYHLRMMWLTMIGRAVQCDECGEYWRTEELTRGWCAPCIARAMAYFVSGGGCVTMPMERRLRSVR